MTKYSMHIFQATKQQLSGEKWDVGHLSTFGSAVLLCFFLFFFSKNNKTAEPKADKCPTSHFFTV